MGMTSRFTRKLGVFFFTWGCLIKIPQLNPVDCYLWEMMINHWVANQSALVLGQRCVLGREKGHPTKCSLATNEGACWVSWWAQALIRLGIPHALAKFNSPVDSDTGYGLLAGATGMSAAFLASQSTPTMSVVAGYLWVRLCFEACLKVGGDMWWLATCEGPWFQRYERGDVCSYDPSALRGLGLFNPTVSYGSSTPDHLASYVGSAALSRDVSFRKDTELRVVRSLCASIADIFGENHHEMVAMSLLLEKSSSKPGEESAHPNTRIAKSARRNADLATEGNVKAIASTVVFMHLKCPIRGNINGIDITMTYYDHGDLVTKQLAFLNRI